MTHEQLSTRSATTATRTSAPPETTTSAPMSPVPLPVIRRDPTTGGTTTKPPPAPKAPDPSTLMPPAIEVLLGHKPTLSEAVAELQKYHHTKKDAAKFSNTGRLKIAEAWGAYVLALVGSKKGKILSSYKSSHDKGADDYSVSVEVDGVADIVIHAHMSGAAPATTGHSPVHWKWAGPGELLKESYKIGPTEAAALIDSVTAQKHYLASITLPTGGATSTPPTTGGATGGGTGGGSAGGGTVTAPTVTLPTTPTTGTP